MKRLFMLRDEAGRPFMGIPKANGPLCFETKTEAKDRRDEVNTLYADPNYVHVSPGPDHHNFKGMQAAALMSYGK